MRVPALVSFLTLVPAGRSVGTGTGRKRLLSAWTKKGLLRLGPRRLGLLGGFRSTCGRDPSGEPLVGVVLDLLAQPCRTRLWPPGSGLEHGSRPVAVTRSRSP
jgi:hypothetical protein